jgi:hypothetical protein
MKLNTIRATVMGVVTIGALTSCAFPDSTYTWYKEREPLPFTWHIVPQEAVQAYCSEYKGYAMACAYWVEGDHCWIFTASERNMRLTKAHEEKHCAGWSH